eukprot:5372681-Amphidinium_carterae.2
MYPHTKHLTSPFSDVEFCFYVFKCSYSIVQGDDTLAYHKNQIQLAWCADESQDYRSFTGLKNTLARLSKKSDKAAERLLLQQFQDQILMANRLHAKTFASVSDAELHRILTMFKEEGVVVSAATQTQLFERQLDKHLQHSEYKAAIDFTWPFHETAFDVLNPKMSGRKLEMSEKIVEFQQVLFHKILVPLILDAMCRKPLLAELVGHAMQELEKLDIVLFESATLAVAHDETLSLLRAIHTLLVCGSSDGKLFEVMT